MALSENDKLEIKKLIRQELINAEIDIAQRFQDNQSDLDVRQSAQIISQIILGVLRERYSELHK